MSEESPLKELLDFMQNSAYFRVVLFGASNTERYYPYTHWGDVLEAGLRWRYERKFHLINSGVNGNNTREALRRFDRDVASFAPDIVIVTLGGNDCIPALSRHVPETEFAANMSLIARKIRQLGAYPVFQTYYKMDSANMEPQRAENFLRYMQIVRQCAIADKILLVDQYKVFDRADMDTLRYKLLINAMHVSEYGNMLMGTVLLNRLQIDARKLYHGEKVLAAAELFRQLTGCEPGSGLQ
ncbi:MAG: hypothetical protein E7056_07625 [Lentisphaerae bacterium]|nr:hypothetical protein [Lentisphaerota bacterium]